MGNKIAPVIELWKERMCNHIKEYVPYQQSQQLQQMAALFSPGLFYYYIVNFHSLQMIHVHEGTQKILGVSPEVFNLQILLEMLTAEEVEQVAKKEALIINFFHDYLTSDDIPFYKAVYFFRIRDRAGKMHTMLHQAITLSISDTGKIENVLGIQTDVSHLGLTPNNSVSLISLNSGPSYYNIDTEEGIFDPSNSRPIGAHSKLFTKRELEVIKLFAEGYTAAQVAEKLYIAENTVRTHRKKILEKTACSNMTELVASCLMEGVI